jgi:type I site-specific restriction-modification system R (restriction) subunit
VDVVAKSDLIKDVVLSGCIKDLLGDKTKDIHLLDAYYQEKIEEPEDNAEDEEMEQMVEVKWDTEEQKSEESDENVAEERVPIDEEVTEKPIESIEEIKKGEINIAEIKAKLKKQFKNHNKKEKVLLPYL